ncbi:MAG: winged helix-turn-helix transcriptional regulator [Gammaproteobacteria bacterium]|nr:winged helix-turn-helix transcriptional regulator [Gammaproteobacteria bacterium]MDH3380502.1 winged helix-turn-helix transcriptional regulator [Gammaproteobacteria bacterium]
MNDTSDREERLTLQLLDAIERQSNVSQRHLARHLGVALGLANSYLKRCAKKGYVKIREAPANRYLYYLTPKGFAEKARLTAQFLSTSLTFYRQAGGACTLVFDVSERNGWDQLVLCGISDLAEIAYMRALESQVEVIGIFDSVTERKHFFGKPVWKDLRSCKDADAYVITDLVAPLDLYRDLANRIGTDRILVPAVLGIHDLVTYTDQQEEIDRAADS